MYGFGCGSTAPGDPWLKTFFEFIAPRFSPFSKQRLTCIAAVHWFPVLSTTGW
jgi:hypothetical protein